MDPQQRWGGWVIFLSFKTPAVMVKCTIQMENPKYQAVWPKKPEIHTYIRTFWGSSSTEVENFGKILLHGHAQNVALLKARICQK